MAGQWRRGFGGGAVGVVVGALLGLGVGGACVRCCCCHAAGCENMASGDGVSISGWNYFEMEKVFAQPTTSPL